MFTLKTKNNMNTTDLLVNFVAIMRPLLSLAIQSLFVMI